MTVTAADRASELAGDDRSRADVLARLDRQLDDLVEAATLAIFAEIPAYHASVDPRLRRDVPQHVREHLEAALDSFQRHREVTREDLMFIRRHASQRIEQLSIADFIHAFQVGQRILWDATLSLATDDASRRAVLGLVAHVPRYFDVAITHAAEVYLEAEKLLGATGERLRRDVLEDLLAGVPLPPGPGMNALRDAGLDPRGQCIVMSAEPVAPVQDVHALRSAASALSRVTRRAVAPFTVIRHNEIVVVAPARTGDVTGVAERLTATQHRLQERDLPLAIGLSTVHLGLAAVPAAYREAADARGLLGARAGTVALPAMTAFDYLVRHTSPTARRLIPAAIERFVAEDAAQAGVLVATLRAYAAADLNIKQASEDLHVHVNTARYRLDKIEERTGANLRHVTDLIELLIAAQVAPAPPLQAAP
ncbi:MAG: PucR family transcriptional regulator [Solirubrobacteraceae bacterium]